MMMFNEWGPERAAKFPLPHSSITLNIFWCLQKSCFYNCNGREKPCFSPCKSHNLCFRILRYVNNRPHTEVIAFQKEEKLKCVYFRNTEK